MNDRHLQLCGSREWSTFVAEQLLPWVVEGVDLGNELLEVGPGLGATTQVLRRSVEHLTAVELDRTLAAGLARTFRNSNVSVVVADATRLPMRDDRVDAAASFTMLHHVPSVALQDRLLSELARVLRPGGILLGRESLDGPAFRDLHDGDVCLPVDPLTLMDRLRQAGFDETDVTVADAGIRFRGRSAKVAG